MADIADAAAAEPRGAEDWRRKELVAAFVGPAWDEYEKTYQRLIEGRSGLGFDVTLFFVPWIWLSYRKLYLAGIAVWVLDVLPRPVGWWIAALTLLAHIAVAVYGKAYFLKRAMAEVDSVRAVAPSDPVAFDRLKDGGVAKGIGFFGVILPLLVIAMMIGSMDFHFTFMD